MRANLSLMGMYQYDDTILDNLVIPTGMDSDTLKENLLMEAAELEVLYTDFDFLKLAIGSWSKKQLPVWTELLKTTQYEYNPIWNKDGSISEVVTRNLAATEDVSDVNTRTHADTDTTTMNNTDTETRNLAGTNDSTTSHGVFGYNSSTKAPESEDIIDQDTSDTGTITDAHTGTITDAHTGTITDARVIDRDTSDTGTIATYRTEQGNIGLTSTQDLIKAQRDVVQINIMDIIIHDFIDRFCLKIY